MVYTPLDAVECFKSTIDMLLVSGEDKASLVGSINLPTLNTLGAIALQYYDAGGKGEIVDSLEPYQKNVLLRIAMDFGLFNSITPDENEEYDADVYNEIKALCKPFELSSWAKKDEIYMLEFLYYLGLTGSEIEGEVTSYVVDLIDSSHGFSDDAVENLNAFKGFGVNLSRNDELYEHALKSFEQTVNRTPYASSFASNFSNMYEFFRKVPKNSRKLLKDHISYLVFQDTLDSEQIADLLWSQEMYKRINKSSNFFPLLHADVSNIDELFELVPEIFDSDNFGKGYMKSTTDVLKGSRAKGGMRYEKKMIDQAVTMFVRNVDDKLLDDYFRVFQILFNSSLNKPIASYIVDLVLEKKERNQSNLWDSDFGFRNSWYDIGSFAGRFKTYFHIDMFDKIMRQTVGSHAADFQDSIEKRIYSELAEGDFDGITFLKYNIGDKSISRFKDRFVECYNSKNKGDMSSEDSGDENLSAFLFTAQKYKEFFDEYPPEFLDKFQDKVSVEFDRIIKASVDSGVSSENRDTFDFLIETFGDDIRSLPHLEKKANTIKKVIEEYI